VHYLEKELKELSIKELDILTFMQDALFDGMWYWDVIKPDNEWMDDRFWKTFGYDPSEMTASPSSWQGIVHPDDLKVAYVMIEKLILDPTYKYDQILRYTHKKGHTVWIRCRGKAVRNDEGRALRILGLHQEITDYKKNESQIQEQIGRYNEVIARTGMSTWRYFLNENIIEHSSIDRVPVIEIHAHLSSPYVELQISDQGKGIDLANFGGRLFIMYSPIGRNEGKGLGLFITKNQVEAMGGSIEVKSKLNKGTTVKIRLIEDGSNLSKNLAK